VDATALFLMLLAEHARWTGTLETFRELRPNVERALAWMDGPGDANGDGYLEYPYPHGSAQINLGWKDSADCIVTRSGSKARSPISLVEAQAYAYRARMDVADLLRRAGEAGRAEKLVAQAGALRKRFERDYWMPEREFYALALHGRGARADAIASNAGHALWCGIAGRRRAAAVRRRLMAEDMFSGWGIRTLSEREKAYNPVSYHLGTVWPHDNGLAAAGLRAYGYDDDAMRIFEAMIAAADGFPDRRLPELFCGFTRREFPQPARYPIACHPQAWASGTLPFLLTTCLGLRPDAFAKRLRVVRPALPGNCGHLEWRRLRVGKARVDLRFERARDGVRVRVLRKEGGLELQVEGAAGRN
jgi:glycogen debranching enzyme